MQEDTLPMSTVKLLQAKLKKIKKLQQELDNDPYIRFLKDRSVL